MYQDDVYDEAVHDWLEERDQLRADELPTRTELEHDARMTRRASDSRMHGDDNVVSLTDALRAGWGNDDLGGPDAA